MTPGEWERHSQWWVDQFTNGADAEYSEQILPLIHDRLDPLRHHRVIDVGSGEGQVARDLIARGHDVLGVESARAQRDAMVAQSPTALVVAGDATALPVRPTSADAVVIVLVLEHIVDLDAAIAEAVAVLRPGGRLIAAINHPIAQTPESGWIDDHMVDPPEQYWRLGSYLVESTSVEEVDKGVFLTFHFRPLHRYVNAAASQGMVLTEMLEPPPPPGFIGESPQYSGLATIPRLMMLIWDKPQD